VGGVYKIRKNEREEKRGKDKKRDRKRWIGERIGGIRN